MIRRRFALVSMGAIPILAYQGCTDSESLEFATISPHDYQIAQDPLEFFVQPQAKSAAAHLLKAISVRITPPGSAYKISQAVHYLHATGPVSGAIVPSITNAIEGERLLNIFIDDSVFREVFGPVTAPLLQAQDAGVEIRYWRAGDANDGELKHADTVLRTLAEWGISTNQTLVLRNGVATVGDIVRESMASISHMRELPWTAEALMRYAPDSGVWLNRFGEQFSLQLLVDRMTNVPNEKGPCFGSHIPYALAVVSRLAGDRFSPRLNRKVVNYLAQYRDGFITEFKQGMRITDGEMNPRIYRAFVKWGHDLETFSVLAPEHRPRESTLSNLVELLHHLVVRHDGTDKRWQYLPACHIAAAAANLAGIRFAPNP